MLDFLIFAVTVIVFLVVAVIYLYPGSKRPTTIPGPEPVDALEGNVPDILACGSLHEFLCKIHDDYGSIVSFWMGQQLYVSIASAKLFAEQAPFFNRACDLFASVLPLIGENSIQVANGTEGRRRHAAYSKCFTPTAVRAYYGVYNKLSQEVIDKWSKWPAEDFIPVMEQMFDFGIRNILIAGFGFKAEDEHLIKQIHASYDICMGEVDLQFKGDFAEAGSARMKRFNEHKDQLYKLIADAVNARKGATHGDEPRTVIDAALSLDLPESTIYSDVLTTFIGGFHTTASLLTWAIYYLALNPDVQEKAREEVKEVVGNAEEVTAESVEQLVYLRQILNESLRCGIVGPYAARAEDMDLSLGGHTIPAGTPVIHALGVALHDPEVFPEPEKFDPERFSPENEENLPPYAFEPFGFAGKRKCFGYRFSLGEASVLLAKLLRADLRLTLAPDQVVVKKFSLVCFPEDELWITVEPVKRD